MEDLFKKFLDNHCSPEELKRLLGYFNNPANEVLLRKLINEFITNPEFDNTGRRKTYLSDDVFKEMKKNLNALK